MHGSAVRITGTGVLSCAGESPEDLWINILKDHSELYEGLGYGPRLELKKLKTQKPSSSLQHLALDFCLHAARDAMRQAGWSNLEADDGIILATTTGQILTWDQSWVEFVKGTSDVQQFRKSFITQPLGSLLGDLAENLAEGNPQNPFGENSPQQLVSSACTASTQALALGALWLKSGRVKRCLVGGVEVLCDLTIQGFRSLQLLSPARATPFEKDRAGINLSEGAAFVCLEADGLSKPLRAKNILASLSGIGMSSDAYHMTSPDPQGKGCEKAIRKALNSAGLLPQDIDWILCHGTGSAHNDLSEGRAIKSIFGDQSIFVCSTKSVHGHALAASGLIETVVAIKALEHQTLLRTPGLKNPDEEIPVHHLDSARKKADLRHILKTTLGFGGANAALIISRCDNERGVP